MTRIARLLSMGIIALAMAAACGGSDESAAPNAPAATPTPYAKAPAAQPAPAEPKPLPAAEPAAEPPAAAAASPDSAQGAQLYATYCSSCHGARGAGDGPVAAALDPKPAKHSDGTYMNALSNEHLFKVIQQGGAAVGKSPLMAPWGGTLSDAQIWDVVAFVRSLAEPPYKGSVP